MRAKYLQRRTAHKQGPAQNAATAKRPLHYHNMKARAEKQAYVEAEKVRRGCANCSECHPACLEFHHLDPSTKEGQLSTLAQMVDRRRSYAALDAEMAKCDVLCSNCHRKEHYHLRHGRSSELRLLA